MTSPVTDWSTLPLLLTPEEARAIVRVGRRQIYAALAAGVFPSVRIGHSLRVPRDALRRLFEGDHVEATGVEG